MSVKQLKLPGPLVTKSNSLLRGHWNPNDVVGLRIVALVASMVNKKDKDLEEYKFSANLILHARPHLDERVSLKSRIELLMSKTITIEEPDGDYAVYNVFSKCKYSVQNNEIVARFDPDLKPHFLNLNKKFKSYLLEEFLLLSSKYAQKIFEYTKSWSSESETSIDINELHEMLGTSDEIRRTYTQLKRKVLEPAFRNITQKTSFDYEWEPIYAFKGRKRVTAIRFVFSHGKIQKLRSPAYRFKKLAKKRQEEWHIAFKDSFSHTPESILKEWTWLDDPDSEDYLACFGKFLEEKLF